MARTRSSSTPPRAAGLSNAETPELQAVGVEPFAPSPRAYTESHESKVYKMLPAPFPDTDAGVLINSSLADGVELGARAVVLNSVLVRGTRVGPNALLNGLMCYDFGSQSAGAAAAVITTKNTKSANTATSDTVIIPANVVLQGFWVHSEALGGAAPGHNRRSKTQSQVALPSAEQKGVRVLAIWGSDDALDAPLEVNSATRDTALTNSFCGQLWCAFQQRTGIRDDDLWPESKVCNTNSCTGTCILLKVVSYKRLF